MVLKEESVVTMLLREKINEIRQAKRVSIDRITKTGISKNKYYRFVSGEGSLSIGDLQKLIELLTVSLSEVVADSSERDQLIFNEFGDYFTLDVTEYERRAKDAARRYMATKLTAYYTISTVYELGAAHKKDEPTSDYVDDLYNTCKSKILYYF